MAEVKQLLERFRAPVGEKVRLKDYDPGWNGDKNRDEKDRRRQAGEILAQDLEELAQAQDLLYASDTWGVLMVLQAMDAAGKDSTIKHVMSGVNPAGCQVYSFKQPSAEELDHNFLWRYAKCVPERGRIGIFNRSYYEEVLVVKVHQEFLESQKLPPHKVNKEFWNQRYEDINAFERHLVRNGIIILKFFLHVSKSEQRKRFLKRLEDPAKNWKYSPSDLVERAYWDDYMRAFEDAITATSTDEAPWYIVPADHKWVTRTVVAAVLTRAIAKLNLSYPKVGPEKQAMLEEARRKLMKEEKD